MNDRTHGPTSPRTVSVLRILFGLALVLTLAATLLVEKHPHFGIDGTFGFYAWYGFLGCTLLILLSRLVGTVLTQPEAGYDD